MSTNFKKLNLISIFFYMWNLIETQKQTEFCGTRKPVVSICNGGELYNKKSVNIDTERASFQQKPCLCTISSANNATPLDIDFVNTSNRSNIKNFQFRVNDVVLNSSVTSKQTLTGEIKLLFTTRRRSTKGGVCLWIRTGRHLTSKADDAITFNITCAAQTTTTDVPADNGTRPHAVPIVLSVTGALLLIAGLVIVHVVVKRYWMAQKNRNNVDHAPSSSEHTQGRNTYVSGVDHYLKMSDNVCKINKSEKCGGYRSSVQQHDEESYELVGVCNKLVGGQGQLSSRSHIYESMHTPVESRSYSKTFENSR